MASSFWQRVAVYFGLAEDREEVERDREAAELSTREIAVQTIKFGVVAVVLWTLFDWAIHGFGHLVSSMIGGVLVGGASSVAGFFATRASRDRGRARAEHEAALQSGACDATGRSSPPDAGSPG